MPPDLQLVVFVGPPGTGKSSLARSVARELRVTYLDQETIRDRTLPLLRGLKLEQGPALARSLALDLLTDLARDNLSLGLAVVLDSPAPYAMLREKLEPVARAHRAELKLVECFSTAEAPHRDEGEPPWREPEPAVRVPGPRLLLDTAEPMLVNLRKALIYLGSAA
jgi:predicted kinase